MGVGDPDVLMAEREIRRRLVDYCRGIDTCDAELTASAYHPDADDDHGSYKGNGHEFAAYAADALRTRFEATQHTTGDPAIDFVDDTTADVVTYVEARHLGRDDDGHFLVTFGGEYRDRFERRDGAWRIASRVVVRAWDATERIELAFPPGRFAERIRRPD